MSEGWAALARAVDQARGEIAAQAPDAATLAEGEGYVARVVAAALADACLPHLLVEGGLTRTLPVKGGPNPDYRMASARIDPQRSYRLEGRLNDSERVGVGLYAVEDAGLLEVGHAAFAAGDGEFALTLAAGASGGDTLAIPPDARVLLTRTLHRSNGVPARLSLAGGPPPPGLDLTGPEAALARAAGSILGGVREYLGWTRAVDAMRNRLADPPPELAAAVQGDRDTQYLLGAFDLNADAYLEVTIPPDLPGYWSLHVYSYWFEHLRGEDAHDRNCVADADGAIRVRIGPSPPADLPNRIETLGRHRGALICRIIGAPRQPPPAARVVTAGS